MGEMILSKSLIQFSLERQGCVPSLLLDLRPDCGGGNEDNGDLLQKVSVPPTLQQDYKESWAWKNWCFWTVVLEKTIESPLDCKEIQSFHPKGNQSWIFIEMNADAEAETLIIWPPDAKNWLLGKEPDAGKYWRQEEKGTTEGEMVGWHHWLNGHEFEQASGAGDGQGSLACCNPWWCKESDMTEWLNWTELNSLIELYVAQKFPEFPNATDGVRSFT